MPIVKRERGIREKEKHLGHQEVGFKFKTAQWYITPTDADLFCDIVGLRQTQFLDDDAAAALGKIGEQGRFLPGPMEMGIHEGLLFDLGVNVKAEYVGWPTLRFIAPVHVNEMVYMEGELVKKELGRKEDKYLCTYTWKMRNQNDVVVSEGEATALFPNPEWKG
jgi:acyl dehydratase